MGFAFTTKGNGPGSDWSTSRLGLLGGVLGLALLALASPLKLGMVSGNSMKPAFNSGQPYLLDRGYYRLRPVQRGDVVVFHRAGSTYIKRVVATEGDSVYLLKEGSSDEDTLLQDWQLARMQRIVKKFPWKRTMRIVRRRVLPGCCYVLGDNFDDSVDSRYYGEVQIEAIQGKVLGTRDPERPELRHIAGTFHTVDHS